MSDIENLKNSELPIYLYGAGELAEACFCHLKDLYNIEIAGVIVPKQYLKEVSTFNGFLIQPAEQILNNNLSANIVLCFLKDDYSDIVNNLKEIAPNCNFFIAPEIISEEHLSNFDNVYLTCSDCLEDFILSKMLPEINNGIYIDVEANSPCFGSITKRFYDKGWRGINVEPLEEYYKELTIKRPRDINLNYGCGSEETTMEFVAENLKTIKPTMMQYRFFYINDKKWAIPVSDKNLNYQRREM